ncbi:hypothetical protein [Actinacidiphila glaucinigra]|uniref:hypothetical protein n=1 Tax=Actinacidiphila glaucinigra TaxID=235986 RepID=UPI000B7733CF|nr:hypothetical protein [Actinacidiphila glaucinigra]
MGASGLPAVSAAGLLHRLRGDRSGALWAAVGAAVVACAVLAVAASAVSAWSALRGGAVALAGLRE